ncbi:HWE histidine kinase domain-containing protein [Oryzifoliimicrobium ureilyticus]|uniref:HWE histidine kinase domain-containing protein n=1 Tax=Oryzifoliimicrobium ureilyticus TaxID=3113724 RepID=UPI0030766FF2
MSVSSHQVDLTNCDREPIHKLGAIQPFGFLIALSSDWLIAAASINTEQFIGVAHQDLLSQPLGNFFGSKTIHLLRNRLAAIRGPDIVERLLGIPLKEDDDSRFDVALHISNDQIIIEAEPSQHEDAGSSPLSTRSLMSRLDQAQTMEAFYREGARQARALTGFDRVMVYKFDATGSGEVVAEATRPGIGSFLGLHYPASDIPVQARTLYLRNLFRIIADVSAEPVAVSPTLAPDGSELDLSMSILRSVSPIHIEYLKNMGVGASLSISIVVDGKLWGLFACHHYSARLPSFERRSTSELFGQMFASRLESRERRMALEFETRARGVADRLLTSIADNASLLDDPAWLVEALETVIPADGIGVWISGKAALTGISPSVTQFTELVKILNRNAAGRVFSTDRIKEIWPEAAADNNATAGLIAIPISRMPRDYVVLFRQELVRTVRWGGDPHKPVEYGPNGPRLTPRKSFEAWSELVRGRSLPFSPAELRVAETIRVTLIEVVLRLADETSAVRVQANERQELLIAELNHRVRNILSLISGLIRQTRGGYDNVPDFVQQLEGRVQALARAHDQITRDHWSPAPLRSLLQAEAAAYLGKNAARIIIRGQQVLLTPQAFSTAALVFHELVTNSAKYGSLCDSGTVEVSWLKNDDGDLSIAWRESGGPPVSKPKRQGFGSTIIRHSIPYDLGGKSTVRYRPEGFEADFIIPGRFVTLEEGEAVETPLLNEREILESRREAVAKRLEGRSVLLVEDNLIIAMDCEDILRGLGAAQLAMAPNIAQAMEAMRDTHFDLAILDVNLGEENSLPIAHRLAAMQVPFIFATGYGEAMIRTEGFEDMPVLQKPYTSDAIVSALDLLASTHTD